MDKTHKPPPPAEKSETGVRRALQKAKAGLRKVPGPSTNPVTNLIIADIALRGLSTIARHAIERALIRSHFSKNDARRIIHGKTMKQSVASHLIANTATKSVPGFLLVAGGLLGKALIDRGLSRGEAEAKGSKGSEEPADNAED